MSSVLDFLDPDDRSQEEVLASLVAAVSDFDTRTGGFLMNARSEEDLESRIRFTDSLIEASAQGGNVDKSLLTGAIRDRWAKKHAIRKDAQDVVDYFKNAAHVFQTREDQENDRWSLETDDGEVRSGFQSREEAEEALRDIR